jgi:hypothetical protein
MKDSPDNRRGDAFHCSDPPHACWWIVSNVGHDSIFQIPRMQCSGSPSVMCGRNKCTSFPEVLVNTGEHSCIRN